MTKRIELARGDALLVVDIQNDFLPGGSLAVPHGDEVIEPLNAAIRSFERKGLPIFASRDWHPPNHMSFTARGGPWPPHCVAGTPGAAFSDRLRLPEGIEVVSKATDSEVEAYSAFKGTGLLELLRKHGVRRVFIGGLTMEYCVRNSVQDAKHGGLPIVVLEDAVKPITQDPDEVEAIKREMREAGATLIRTPEIVEPEAASATEVA